MIALIKYLSYKIADYLVEDDGDDRDILAYGYELILQEVGVVLLLALLAVPFGVVVHTLVSLVVYNFLRHFAGGAHAKHRAVCVLSSLLFMFGPALLFVKGGFHLPVPAVVGLYFADAVLLACYAPADTVVKPIPGAADRKRMRRGALWIATAYLAAALLLYGRWAVFSSVIMVVATIVCLTTHPLVYRLYGCQRATDPERRKGPSNQ